MQEAGTEMSKLISLALLLELMTHKIIRNHMLKVIYNFNAIFKNVCVIEIMLFSVEGNRLCGDFPTQFLLLTLNWE